ncbi:MAG: hypothetical protein V4772_25410 [Pseudomonadota bacterium]
MNGEAENTSVLVKLGEVDGQLKLMAQMMQQHHDSTNRRIEDMRHSVEGQIEGVERRVETLEQNERSTAIRSAGSSALVLGAIEVIKFLVGRS